MPWLPYACINSAFLINEHADDYLRNPDLIARGVVETAKRYKADGIPLLFDLSVDAEAVGCKVNWWKDNVPRLPATRAPRWKPPGNWDSHCRMKPRGDGRSSCRRAGRPSRSSTRLDCALVGLYCGPLTLASHLAGVRIFTDVYKNKAFAHEILKFAGEVNAISAARYAALGCEVIGIVDPVASQVRSATFQEFVTPYVKKGIDVIHEAGATSVFLICGDCTKVLEDVCTIGTHAFAIDEQLNLGFVRDMAVKHKLGFAGNLKLTMSLSLGLISTREDTLVSLAMGGTHGFTLAPG